MSENDTGRSRPTAWMAIAAVAVLAAVGLGIWVFVTKSDLDDAEAQLDKRAEQVTSLQNQVASEGQAVAQEGEAVARQRREVARRKAIAARNARPFRRVRARLVGEQRNLQGQIATEADELAQARRATRAAQGQEQRDTAALRQARQEVRLASACAQGTIDAIDEFINANNPDAGARAAMTKLEALQRDCQEVVR